MAVSRYLADRGMAVEELGVAPVVVLSWGRRVLESLAEAVGAQLSRQWMWSKTYPLYTGEVDGTPVCFTHAPIGAPGTVVIMEELIACGARVFLGRGWAGSLQPETPVGTSLIPTTCVREEGTSLHYLEADAGIGPSERLVEALKSASQEEGIKAVSGPIWTTDAPYRELIPKIEAYRRQGVVGVDMETSAMYALGQVRGVDVCNLLVISDELWDEWRPAFGQPELEDADERANRVILRALSKGLIP